MIIAIGDIHGDFYSISKKIEENSLVGCNFLFLGDFGVGFYSYQNDLNNLSKLNKLLDDHYSKAYIIRGNHDDPAYFNGYDSFKLSNINFIKDYSILNIENKNILSIGGAVSVDRSYRIMNIDYWLSEGVVRNLELLNEINEKIDIIISHSSPDFCEPITKNLFVQNWINKDNFLEKDLNIERAYLTDVYNLLKEKDLLNNNFQWLYAHFHKYYFMEKDNYKFYGLDINQFLEIK
jgi:predicted phosphodiesterase